MQVIHVRIDDDTKSYLSALATVNGMSMSATANMLFTHCRKARLGVGLTPDARADARSDAPEGAQ